MHRGKFATLMKLDEYDENTDDGKKKSSYSLIN